MIFFNSAFIFQVELLIEMFAAKQVTYCANLKERQEAFKKLCPNV